MVRFIPSLALTLALAAIVALIIGCGPAATTDTGAATTASAPAATASQPAPASDLTATATDAPPASAAGQSAKTPATASTASTAPVQTPAETPDNISPVGAEPGAVDPTPDPPQISRSDSADAQTPPAAAVVDPDTANTDTPVAPDKVAPANPVAAAEPSESAAPRFTLPSANYETVALDSYIGEKNVVLVFYRAFW